MQTSAPGIASGSLQVTGQLVHSPELRHTTNGMAVLCFQLATGAGLPYIVHQMIAADPIALRGAEAKARRMREGDLVHVYAHGCRPRTDHDTAALMLLDVTDVIIHEE